MRGESARAFTLIEVLVVVAIIALLVSILIPALTRAKDQARRAVCAAHLHQQMMGVTSYTNDHAGRGMMRGWKTYVLSEIASEVVPGTGQKHKLLCNIGQLYKKYIGAEEDILYCPSTMLYTKYAPTKPGDENGNWSTVWDPAYVRTLSGYCYGIPLAHKNEPGNRKGPGLSPNFRGPTPFPREVWSGLMYQWVETWWVPHNPGMTAADFKVPISPALTFDVWIGGHSPPHSMKTSINVLYTDGHVRAHRQVGGQSAYNPESIETWYNLSIKQ